MRYYADNTSTVFGNDLVQIVICHFTDFCKFCKICINSRKLCDTKTKPSKNELPTLKIRLV